MKMCCFHFEAQENWFVPSRPILPMIELVDCLQIFTQEKRINLTLHYKHKAAVLSAPMTFELCKRVIGMQLRFFHNIQLRCRHSHIYLQEAIVMNCRKTGESLDMFKLNLLLYWIKFFLHLLLILNSFQFYCCVRIDSFGWVSKPIVQLSLLRRRVSFTFRWSRHLDV